MLTYYTSESTICITFINVRLNDIIPECLQSEKSVDYQPRAVRLLTVLAVMAVGLAKDDLEVPKIKYENSRCRWERRQAEWLYHAIYITSSFPGARSFISVAQKLPGSRVIHSCQIFNCMIYTNRKFFFCGGRRKNASTALVILYTAAKQKKYDVRSGKTQPLPNDNNPWREI